MTLILILSLLSVTIIIRLASADTKDPQPASGWYGPTSYTIETGSYISGSVSDLLYEDYTNYMRFAGEKVGFLNWQVEVEFEFSNFPGDHLYYHSWSTPELWIYIYYTDQSYDYYHKIGSYDDGTIDAVWSLNSNKNIDKVLCIWKVAVWGSCPIDQLSVLVD